MGFGLFLGVEETFGGLVEGNALFHGVGDAFECP